MVYGLETVTVTKKQVEEREATEMKILRFAMRVARKDKVKNEYIRGIVKVEQLGIVVVVVVVVVWRGIHSRSDTNRKVYPFTTPGCCTAWIRY